MKREKGTPNPPQEPPVEQQPADPKHPEIRAGDSEPLLGGGGPPRKE